VRRNRCFLVFPPTTLLCLLSPLVYGSGTVSSPCNQHPRFFLRSQPAGTQRLLLRSHGPKILQQSANASLGFRGAPIWSGFGVIKTVDIWIVDDQILDR